MSPGGKVTTPYVIEFHVVSSQGANYGYDKIGEKFDIDKCPCMKIDLSHKKNSCKFDNCITFNMLGRSCQ